MTASTAVNKITSALMTLLHFSYGSYHKNLVSLERVITELRVIQSYPSNIQMLMQEKTTTRIVLKA